MMRKSIGLAVAAAMAMGQALTLENLMRHMGGESTPRTATGSGAGMRRHFGRMGGMSCAAVKRAKVKIRNRLRSKGQFRQAVR